MVPVIRPSSVTVSSWHSDVPKSVSFAVPSAVTSTFPGDTSRWTTPAACAAASAPAICAPIQAVLTASTGPSRSRSARLRDGR